MLEIIWFLWIGLSVTFGYKLGKDSVIEPIKERLRLSSYLGQRITEDELKDLIK